ncbi:MAG: helix-turn-helix domain-containing protein [Eggerthellaceae bacterium]|nr:helix-turn-helix domain-containing protein [Eggerthellaceae bacterium]
MSKRLFNQSLDRRRIYINFIRSMQRQFCVGLTFCFCLVWMLVVSVGPDLVLPAALPFSSLGALPSWIVPLACLTFSHMIVAGVFRQTRKAPQSMTRLPLLGAALVTAAIFHLLWVLDPRVENWLPYLLSSFLFGGAGAFLRIEMNRMLGWLGAQNTIYQGIVGTLAAAVIFVFLANAPDICLFVATPLVGVLVTVSLWHCIKGIPYNRYYQKADDIKLHFPVKFVATSLVQGSAVGVMYLGVFFTGAHSFGDEMHFVSNVFAMVAVFFCIVFFRLNYNRLVYKIAFPIIAAGFILLSIIQTNVAIGFTTIFLGFCFLDLVLWSLGSYLIKNMGLPAPWIASCLGAALCFGVLAGSLAVIAARAASLPANLLYGWGSLYGCVLLAFALFLSNSNNLKYGWGTVRPGDGASAIDALDAVVLFLSKEHNLTNRESEILFLLAEGKTRRAMCAELCVSADTIKTHVKNVYRKLLVHSQQELVDFVAREKEKFETVSEGD